MAPPRKAVEDGTVDVHAGITPLGTPLAFVSPSVLCYVVGNSVCLWNITDGTKSFIHTNVHNITKICGNAARGLVAFCEGCTHPSAFVYNTDTRKLLFTLTDLTELELADISFSSCGSRLYALSRATSRRLLVFSTQTGQKLKGCEVDLPLRFDKVVIYPEHKDHVALVRSSTVRIVTIQKSYETYIMRLQPASIPTDADISISAYAWTSQAHFLFATRQGALYTLDGTTGQVLHACQAESPVTSIAVTPDYIVTAHIGNALKFWTQHADQFDGGDGFTNLPPMELAWEAAGRAYALQKVACLETLGQTQPLERRLMGQVASLQVMPDKNEALVTTAEGEVWTLYLPAQVSDLQSADGFAGDSVAMNPQDLQMELLTWFHTHPISDVTFLGADSKVCASIDDGGRLRVWEVSKKNDPKGFRTLCFSSALTSFTTDDDGGLLICGSDTGCVSIVDCTIWQRAHVLDAVRISDAGVAKLSSVTEDGRFITVAAALFNNKIAFMTVSLRDPKVKMNGCVDLMAQVEDICFHAKDFQDDPEATPKLLVVGSSNDSAYAGLWAVSAPPATHEPASAELPPSVCQVSSLKLSSPQRLADKPTAVASATKSTVVVGLACGHINVYPVPKTAGPPVAKQPVVQPLEQLHAHDQLITCLHVSRDSTWLVSAAMDGSIRQCPLDSNARLPTQQKVLHNPYNGGVVQACSSPDDNLIVSTGGADGVLVWSNPLARVPTPAPLEDHVPGFEVEEMELLVDVDDRDLPVWEPVTAEEGATQVQADVDDPEMNALGLAQRRALALEVEGLRKKLRVLVDQNNSCPDFEQLERNEFCVDFEERNAIAATAKDRCNSLRAQIERDNVARQLIRDRLIKEFWDTMRSKGCQITSLMTNFAVANYPERIVSEEEHSNMRKLRVMRQVEHNELEMLRAADCPAGLRGDAILKPDLFATGEEKYIVNWWHAEQCAKDGALADQKYLYEPFELLTNCRRRLQIKILQSLAAEYRTVFNELFKTCQTDKKATIEQIKEKITRIRAILAELQIQEQVPEPELQASEEANAILEVKDKEITVEKWLSPEEKKALAEAAAKEEERMRVLRENDAGQRALNQMMGGTLKTKKDLSALETSLEREPWMDQIPDDEMTDMQLQALKEFKDKEKILADEQDKYCKMLDAELKRTKQEVTELMQSFETSLKELHHQRFAHDAKFFCQELYCVRLQLALLQSVEDGQVLKQSEADIEKAAEDLAKATAKLEDFQMAVNAKKEKHDECAKHEREVASAQHFRQQYAQSGLEPETVTSLLQMFRRRRDAGQNKVRQSTVDGRDVQASTGKRGSASAAEIGLAEDPYADLGTIQESASHPSLLEEDQVGERPEDVDEASFQRMIELRQERLQAEVAVQKGSAELHEMAGLLAHLQKERDDAMGTHERLQVELAEHRLLMDRELYDIEILFKLKQGQVEVPQAAVVTDYSDAVVIDKEVVESRNRRILELGKDKVGTLETIKEFRKRLGLTQWEYKMLHMQTIDLEERTKDVHMLRVTKDLQSLLKGGEEGRNKADADLLERKIEHLSSTTQQKEQSLKKQYSVFSQSGKLRKMENTMLEKKLRELQQNVIQREHIRRLRAPQGGGPQSGAKEGEKPRIVGGGGRIEENEASIRAAQTGFREVKQRQVLMETAKKHTEEIDLLRKELDRLRQKTFPSFVQLHEDRVANPDHVSR